MSGEQKESQEEQSQDPQLKCLALVEKIISSLNDQDIKNRYFCLKENILSNSSSGISSPSDSQQKTSDKAYAFYQSLSQENEKLKEQLAEISLRKPDFSNDPENEAIAAQIRELERKILPTHPLPPSGNAVQELETLKKVIDAKLNSLNFVRDKLRTENQRLKNDYREISQALSHKIEAAKEKEDSEQREIASQERQLADEIKKSQQELETVTEKYRKANEENNKIRQKLNETLALHEKLKNESKDTDVMIKKMESENISLFSEIEQLKTQLNIKTKELTSLQTLQKFGVEVSDDIDITDEIEKLTKQRNALKSDNNQLAFDLKKMDEYPTPDVLTSTETISLDEDELAAQILNSKWH